MIDPVHGVPFFVLGRSRPVDSWVEGSFLWGDFGGVPHPRESPEVCAARELVEESCGVIVRPVDTELFARALCDEQFVMRYEDERAVVFVVRFDWKPGLPYEFNKLFVQLRALSRVARGVPLSAAERLLLCRFRWLQSQSDSGLQALLGHPAVMKRRQLLPFSAIEKASHSLSDALGSAHRNMDIQMPVSCLVVDGIRPTWLEKDRLELFSIQQVQQVLRPSGLTCAQGQTLEFSPELLSILRAVLRALVTGRFTCRVQGEVYAQTTVPR
jgi:hypothetical protein